jgi:hypothetical protein
MTSATTLSLRPGSLSVYISPWGPYDSDPSLFSFRFYFDLYPHTTSVQATLYGLSVIHYSVPHHSLWLVARSRHKYQVYGLLRQS